MLSKSRAQQLAVEALVFIASDDELASEMLAASGVQPADLRIVATNPEFGIFLLDFILQDDRRVLDFARTQPVEPESVLHAREILSGLKPGMHHDGQDYV